MCVRILNPWLGNLVEGLSTSSNHAMGRSFNQICLYHTYIHLLFSLHKSTRLHSHLHTYTQSIHTHIYIYTDGHTHSYNSTPTVHTYTHIQLTHTPIHNFKSVTSQLTFQYISLLHNIHMFPITLVFLYAHTPHPSLVVLCYSWGTFTLFVFIFQPIHSMTCDSPRLCQLFIRKLSMGVEHFP